jgi:hypothetical protein
MEKRRRGESASHRGKQQRKEKQYLQDSVGRHILGTDDIDRGIVSPKMKASAVSRAKEYVFALKHLYRQEQCGGGKYASG